MWMRHQALLLAGGLSLLGLPGLARAQTNPPTPPTSSSAKPSKQPPKPGTGTRRSPAASAQSTPAQGTPPPWPASRPRVEVTATSQLATGQDNAPWRIFDGWASGLWCEGVAGPGLREAVTVRFDAPIRLERVEVQGGVLASEDHFHANHVPIGWRLSSDAGFSESEKDTAYGSAAPSRGPSGLTRFTLPGAPVKSVQLQLEGVLRKDGVEHTCISELRFFTPGAEDPVSPVPLPADAYRALPGEVTALMKALEGCSETELKARVHFPLWWDVPEATVKSEGATVTPVTTLKFRTPAELSRACAERPHETPRAPSGTSLEKLLEGLYVEAPDRVALTFPSQPGEEGMRWRLTWRKNRWRLLDAQR